MNLLATANKIGIEGFMESWELERLAELAINQDVLEIGSFRGLSTWAMLVGAKSLWSVDTHKANSAGQQQMEDHTTLAFFQHAISRFKNVNYVIADSEIAAQMDALPRDFDMIFLDAMHTYEDVKADIERWYPRVRSGGLMVFHDYAHPHFPGVKQAVDERFGPQSDVVGTLMWMRKPV